MLAIGALFAVFGFLTCRSAAVSPSDVLFLLGFRLDLPFGRVATLATLPKGNAIDQNILEVRFLAHLSTLISQLSTLNSQPSTLNLMMEQAHAREGHGDAILIAGHNNMIVAHRAAGLGDILHTALVGTLDIVAEGEESVATK